MIISCIFLEYATRMFVLQFSSTSESGLGSNASYVGPFHVDASSSKRTKRTKVVSPVADVCPPSCVEERTTCT